MHKRLRSKYETAASGVRACGRCGSSDHTRQECVNEERTHGQFEACLAVLRKFGVGAAMGAAGPVAVAGAETEVALGAEIDAEIDADAQEEEEGQASDNDIDTDAQEEEEHVTDNDINVGEKRSAARAFTNLDYDNLGRGKRYRQSTPWSIIFE